MSDKNNISKLLLNEFYNLSKSDVEIQINKNIERIKNLENKTSTENSKGKEITEENDIEILLEKFYLSLSKYLSNPDPLNLCKENNFASNFKKFKKNYLKIINTYQKHTSGNKVS